MRRLVSFNYHSITLQTLLNILRSADVVGESSVTQLAADAWVAIFPFVVTTSAARHRRVSMLVADIRANPQSLLVLAAALDAILETPTLCDVIMRSGATPSDIRTSDRSSVVKSGDVDGEAKLDGVTGGVEGSVARVVDDTASSLTASREHAECPLELSSQLIALVSSYGSDPSAHAQTLCMSISRVLERVQSSLVSAVVKMPPGYSRNELLVLHRGPVADVPNWNYNSGLPDQLMFKVRLLVVQCPWELRRQSYDHCFCPRW